MVLESKIAAGGSARLRGAQRAELKGKGALYINSTVNGQSQFGEPQRIEQCAHAQGTGRTHAAVTPAQFTHRCTSRVSC
jgi:hypothetical protein